MSDILAKIQAAHAKPTEMVRVSVPEYELELYFPDVTVADRAAIRRGIPDGSDELLMIHGLIHMARDADGKRVFDVPLKDKPALVAELQKIPLHIMQRIIAESAGGLHADVAAEIVAATTTGVRDAIAEALADHPALSEAVLAAEDATLQAALADIVKAHKPGGSTKNA